MNIFTYLRLSTLVLCSFLFTPSYSQVEKDYFITVWSTSSIIEFYYKSTGIVNYSWQAVGSRESGTGTLASSQNGSGAKIWDSNFPFSDFIRLKISPQNLTEFRVENNSYLYEVAQWGAVEWTSMELAFRNSKNLVISAIDIPNLIKVKSMSYMFSYSEKLVSIPNVNNWNTLNVTDMNGMFLVTPFNDDIGNWNTQNVTNMEGMFAGSFFNKDIGKWNTQNVTNMRSMFNENFSFNQPIGNWNVKNVTNMRGMFANARSFNQPVGNFNTKLVTDMSYMFFKATSFNQRLDSLEINASVKLDNMVYNTAIDCKNYSNTLIGWANNSITPTNKAFGAAGVKYSSLAQAARDILTKPEAQGGKGWTITGDALSTEDCGIITSQEEGSEQSVISLYPNPAQDKLFLKNAVAGSSYKIIDGLGKEVNTGSFQSEEISVGTLLAGLYTLLCGTSRFTFVKE